jgi:hypothetical protein
MAQECQAPEQLDEEFVFNRPMSSSGTDELDDAAHKYTDMASLLSKHGWHLVSGDGNADGSRWRRPGSTNSVSATVKYGCLFCYSTEAGLPVTDYGEPHGLTLFSLIAILEHGGDNKKTAQALRDGGYLPKMPWAEVEDIRIIHEIRDVIDDLIDEDGGGDKNGSEPDEDGGGDKNGSEPDEDGGGDKNGSEPDDVLSACQVDWGSRWWLAHISQAAHARLVSREAVLHCVLARIAAFSPHKVRLPAIIGSEVPLTYFAAIIAPPGVGKSGAVAVATELVPPPDGMYECDHLPLGTGEGLIESLFDQVELPDGTKIKEQVRFNAFAVADEGETYAALGGRKGATLGPTLRTAWTGGTLGQANASRVTRRIVPAGNYAFGVVFLFQHSKAGGLLAEEEGGTPQRFAWGLGADASLTADVPEWPGMLKRYELHGDPVLNIAADVVGEVRAAHLAKQQGRTVVQPLDAHRGLLRLKLAGLVAIIEGRVDVTVADWALAEDILNTSDAARATAVAAVAEQKREAENAATKRQAKRKVAEVGAVAQFQEAVRQRKVVDGARAIAKKVWKMDGAITRRELRRNSSQAQRDIFDEVLEHGEAEGWIVCRSESGQGTDRQVVERGEVRP